MDNPAGPNAAKQTATIRYVDQPECRETFTDAVNAVFFDGQTMRIEFGITRMDEMKQGQPLTGRRYPACRLVLPVSAAMDLINKMQQTANALQQAGIVKPTGAPAVAPAAVAPAEKNATVLKAPASDKASILDKLSALDRSSILDKPFRSEK